MSPTWNAACMEAKDARLRLIATDGVFSMDGSLAPLPDICALADKHDAMVMVDDSHATGILGPGGRGSAEALGCLERIDIITSTLGKTLGGAAGGFTCRQPGSRRLSAPALAAVSLLERRAAADHPGGDEGARPRFQEQRPARSPARQCPDPARGLEKAGFTIKPGQHPILPVMLGDAALATKMADKLLEKGIYVIGFSFPVVPQGQARIRIQLSAAHTPEQLERAVQAFTEVGKELGVI